MGDPLAVAALSPGLTYFFFLLVIACLVSSTFSFFVALDALLHGSRLGQGRQRCSCACQGDAGALWGGAVSRRQPAGRPSALQPRGLTLSRAASFFAAGACSPATTPSTRPTASAPSASGYVPLPELSFVVREG